MKKITLTWGYGSTAFRVNERALADRLNQLSGNMDGFPPFPDIVRGIFFTLSRRQLCYAEKSWGVKITLNGEDFGLHIFPASGTSEGAELSWDNKYIGIVADTTAADIYALTGAMKRECMLERDIIPQLIGKRIRWSAPVAADNAKYGGCGGTAIIRAYKPLEHNPLEVETIKGDNLGWAFFDGPGDERFAYGDGGRYISFKVLGDN